MSADHPLVKVGLNDPFAVQDGSLAVAALTDDAANAERYFELLDDIYAELHRKGSAAWIPDGLRHRLYAAIREREARK